MCGIAGVMNGPDGQALDHRRQALAMCAHLVHRGPDGLGIQSWAEGTLAMRRLIVTDPDTGAQPMQAPSGALWVVSNGEIYNHRALRKRLSDGWQFRTRSDTEVIVAAYARFGIEFVRHLEGMFAIAIYDRRKRRVVLARDRFGQKPLYYQTLGGTLRFASEMRALRAGNPLGLSIDLVGVDRFFALQCIPAPTTVFRDVNKLPPGHRLVYEAGQVAIESYYRPTFEPKSNLSVDEAAQRLRTLAESAVDAQVQADVPVGASLSGGIDSTIVAALAAKKMGGGLQTFSVGFDDVAHDERAHARRTAAFLGTSHHDRRVPADVSTLLAELVEAYGEPFSDASMIPTAVLAKLASRRVRVLLGGDGADEVFGGYSRYALMIASERVHTALSHLGLQRALVADGRSRGLKFWKALQASALPSSERYLRFMALHRAGARQRLYQPGLLDALAVQRTDALVEHGLNAKSLDGLSDALMRRDLELYLPSDILTKTDIASMQHAIEIRAPLLDEQLVSFALRLRRHDKIRGLRGKWILKRAFRDLLPLRVRYRKKHGFSAPVGAWFRGPLRAFAHDLLLTGARRYRDYLRPEPVESMLRSHTRGQADKGAALFQLCCFELWLGAHAACVERERAERRTLTFSAVQGVGIGAPT